MIEGRLFGKTIAIMSKALDLRSLNHRVISMNLANINTPNYKAQDVRFEDALQSQIERGASLTMIRTDTRHFPTHSELRSQKEDAVLGEAKTRVGADGNSVDEEREMVRLAENQMMYQALAQVLKRKLGSFKEAIRGGR
jgi:flagellar basal-body rod protein FlgB